MTDLKDDQIDTALVEEVVEEVDDENFINPYINDANYQLKSNVSSKSSYL